jgi:hypothetical protein
MPANGVSNSAPLRRIDQLPEHLGRDLIDACLRASYQIRNDRQHAYDRPVVLEGITGELTFRPIGGVPPKLHVPFTFRASSAAGNVPIQGQLLLGEDDPVPAEIVTDASEEDAISAWITALLGFADATCFKSQGTSHGTSRTAGSHPPHSDHRLYGPSGALAGRQAWPHHLQPVGEWTQYAGSYVAAHRRLLSNEQDHSDEARERARRMAHFCCSLGARRISAWRTSPSGYPPRAA